MQTIILSNLLIILVAITVSTGAYFFVIRPRIKRKLPSKQAGLVFLVEDGQIVDETPAARLALDLTRPANWDWPALSDAFKARFLAFPKSFDAAFEGSPLHVASIVPGDSSRLAITAFGSRLRIELQQSESDTCIAMHHLALLDQMTLASMSRAISKSPYPIWDLR